MMTQLLLQVAKILDSKRSQNVGILAQSLHVDFTEIENGKQRNLIMLWFL